MLELVNLTPHEIVLRTDQGDIKIAPNAPAARVQTEQKVVGMINGIPLVKTIFGDVENVPDPQKDVIFIVSSLVASRLPERPDVVAPDTGPTAVRENGQIVAVTRFQKP